jgi:non-ribosomal peptide synthetase component F
MYIIPENKFMFSSQLIDYLNSNQINTIFWVPSAIVNVANSGILEKKELLFIKNVLFCGEVMPNKQLNIWRRYLPEARYANMYGPTEITDVCTCYVIDREFKDDESLPIGFPCHNTEIIVLNENNEECRTDEKGELCVRGICNSFGYFGDYDRTKEVFVQNPLNPYWQDIIYRTGDIVKYNENGELMYLCRKDFQIKHMGHRIELGEIETAAYSISGVKQNCALYDEENKKIYLFCATDTSLSEKEIYQQLCNKLPKYMVPTVIRIIDKLNLNANGKINRKELSLMLKGEGNE